MKKILRLASALSLVILFPYRAISAEVLCNPAAERMPSRSAAALSAAAFMRRIANTDGDEREVLIRDQLITGNIPHFLRRLVPVTLNGTTPEGQEIRIVLCVAPDYLAVGSDEDFLFVPMRLETALVVARRFGSVLPTPKMVDAIYAQARVRLKPQPLPAGDAMRSTPYYWRHNELIRDQHVTAGFPLGELTAGDKKDLVISKRLWLQPMRVAIYGWHRAEGLPIQPLSTVHGERYADYSHGVRLISALAYVNGKAQSVFKLLEDPEFAAALSGEGVIPQVAKLVDRLSARHTLRIAANR